MPDLDQPIGIRKGRRENALRIPYILQGEENNTEDKTNNDFDIFSF